MHNFIHKNYIAEIYWCDYVLYGIKITENIMRTFYVDKMFYFTTILNTKYEFKYFQINFLFCIHPDAKPFQEWRWLKRKNKDKNRLTVHRNHETSSRKTMTEGRILYFQSKEFRDFEFFSWIIYGLCITFYTVTFLSVYRFSSYFAFLSNSITLY